MTLREVEKVSANELNCVVDIKEFLIYFGVTVIMPPSALEQLTRLNITYPMLFKLSNSKKNRTTHCGVLEFVADENKVYIPYWVIVVSFDSKFNHHFLYSIEFFR